MRSMARVVGVCRAHPYCAARGALPRAYLRPLDRLCSQYRGDCRSTHKRAERKQLAQSLQPSLAVHSTLFVRQRLAGAAF